MFNCCYQKKYQRALTTTICLSRRGYQQCIMQLTEFWDLATSKDGLGEEYPKSDLFGCWKCKMEVSVFLKFCN